MSLNKTPNEVRLRTLQDVNSNLIIARVRIGSANIVFVIIVDVSTWIYNKFIIIELVDSIK